MGCEEIGPTEETLGALIEYLVGPLLPLKYTDIAKETPSESKQKTVAKQVHAAVVLYNYYHIRHHQESQFLKFDQFCQLAILLIPSILQHMKYMCQTEKTALTNPESQLSLTEKAVMDACSVCETLLNASDNISNDIITWRIIKVSVLLIDSKKENCFLQFNNGVWSVIEKERITERMTRSKIMYEFMEEDDVEFQKLAFKAVKEVTGIKRATLKVLERHLVYSLSKAKTATLFYIIQSSEAIREDNLVPIQDVISSLQGPVVKKCLGSWAITPVVEYYYLLPYAEIISKFFSRKSKSIPHQVKYGNEDVNIIQRSQKLREKESGERKNASDILQKKSKLDWEFVLVSDSSKKRLRDNKVSEIYYKSNECSEKESGESKKVFDNLQKKSKLDWEFVLDSNSSKEESHDSKFSKILNKSNECSEKENGDSKKVFDNLQKNSKLDWEFVLDSDSSKEECHDSKFSKILNKSNECSEKESGESKKVFDNLQKKSKLDFEFVSKEESHDSKASKILNKSKECSEKESGEVKKVFDNFKKKSKLDSEIVHISNISKKEPHDSKDDKITNDFNQCSSSLKPVSKVADDVITSQVIERPVDQKVREIENSTDNSITVCNSDSMKKEDMNGSCRDILNKSLNGTNNNIAIEKSLICSQTENQNPKFQTPVKIYRYERRSKQQSSSINSKVNSKDLKKMSTISQSKDEDCMVESNEKIKSLAVNHVLEEFNSIVDAKKSELSDAALRALLNKRQKLYDQQRVTEVELTLCDKKIQKIIHGGIGDCLGLKLEAVIECCNEIFKQDEHTNLDASRSFPLSSGNILSEAQLTLRKACQELDDICLLNNWMLPTYCTSRSDVGFVANVTVKGTNFECSGASGDQPNVHEARNSAANDVIKRLHQMANGMNNSTL